MKKLLLLGCIVVSAFVMAHAEVKIQSGDKIAFMGDSITQEGWQHAGGYVKLIVLGLKEIGIEVEPIPVGVSGHKSNQMLERLERDVLAKKPQWMTLSCGVNDVWHGANGVPLDKYKENITAIVEKAQAEGINVIILTSTMIGEDPQNDNNQKLAPYNDFLRELAKERNTLLADLSADMHTALEAIIAKEGPGGNKLTRDGVHMSFAGNKMMARGVLRTLGVSQEDLAKMETMWDNIPGTSNVTVPLSGAEFERLQKAASEKEKSPVDFLRTTF